MSVSQVTPVDEEVVNETTSSELRAQLDRSCRGPVLLLLWASLCWLVVGGFFGLIGAIQLHAPEFLGACPVLTFGHVAGTTSQIFLYGFASQAGLAVSLWLLCRFGRAPLQTAWLAVVGGLFWNLAVLLGVVGILTGGSTGYEWLEMPRAAAAILLLGYSALAISALLTLHHRAVRELYASQWYLLAAVLWFAWIFSGAYLLLLNGEPVRGLVQATVSAWFKNNFAHLWLAPMALAGAFYLVPKITRQPLHNRHLALFGFWSLALFGSWGGISPGAPFPSWMTGVSHCAALLMILPVLAVVINLFQTARAHLPVVKSDLRLRFVAVGLVSYLLSTLLTLGLSFQPVSPITEFTWLSKLPEVFLLYGFVAMTFFAMIYHLTPQLTQGNWPWPKLVSFHFWTAALALALQLIAFGIGGLKQGLALNAAASGFLDSVQATVPFLKINSLAQTLWLLGQGALLVNLVGLLGALCRTCCARTKQAPVKTALAEVTP